MDKVVLQVGDAFQQAWRGCNKPMWFKVLAIDRDNNSIKVECHSIEGYSYVEDWDDLDVTEMAFETGDYKMMK